MQRLISILTSIKSDIFLLYSCLKDSRVSRKIKGLIIGMIIYVVSPMDLFADIIPLFGQLDDILVISMVIAWIKRNTPKNLKDELSGKVIEGK